MTNGNYRTEFLTVDQVADKLGVSSRTVWRLIDKIELIAHRIGGSTRVKVTELQKFIERCRDDRPPDDEPSDDRPPDDQPSDDD